MSGNETCWKDFRLPKDLVPQSYEILIHPDFERFDFRGWSCVEVVVKTSVDYIVMHTKDLNITINDIRYTIYSEKIEIEKHVIVEEREQLFIKLSSHLLKNSHILINISFHGILKNNGEGFFLNFYKTKNKTFRYLAATQMQATYARTVFPCFDEPQMKAEFKMSIIRPKHYISLFNTEKICEKEVSSIETMDIYHSSPKMSTYLVAVVVSDYSSKAHLTKSGTAVAIYAPPDSIDDVDFALDCAVKLLDYYEVYFGIKYPLPKLDIAVINELSIGAMENWGLVLFIPNFLFYNADDNTETDKTMVAIVLAHELAHQWFGNLVTMEWWDDLWLNEGFATYVQYIGAKHIFPDRPLEENFSSETMVPAMISDSSDTSHAISISVEDPKKISEIFDAISYDKGASIIKMLESVIGPEKFKKAIKNYLTSHKFKNAKSSDLWESFSKEYRSLKVKEMMDTWTLQMGFPVVTIRRNGRELSLHQERYLVIDHSKISNFTVEPAKFNYTWNIPLTYFTNRNLTHHSFYQFKQKSAKVPTLLPQNVTWLKANSKMSGFYRVNYDDNGWRDLIKQLKLNHSVFTPIDRGNLLSDAFFLVRSGHVKLEVALELSLYMEKEESNNPWSMMLNSVRPIYNLLSSNFHYSKFKRYMQKIMTPRLKKLGFNNDGNGNLKATKIGMMTFALELGFQEYVDWAKNSFKKIVNGTKLAQLTPDQESMVYKFAVRYGGDEEWNYIMDLALHPNTSIFQKNSLLEALAYTNDDLKFRKFLPLNETAVEPEGYASILYAIRFNPAHGETQWSFLRANWNKTSEIFKHSSTKLRELLSELTAQLSTETQYEQLKTFLMTNRANDSERLNYELLDKVRMNIDWKKKFEGELVQWLEKHFYSSADCDTSDGLKVSTNI
ncbi:hypothetical protein HELRODRAFT_85035 [Helobdella robusta]|uniref:Aminopeptidase n=1 Tax=Helobdella robusta TaxID=6412 RepID=T1G5R6_HELRO|nr:hypothetical protein HELRODRAFT_85035 [Helobdella robusta]ESN97951.1 hypothetical protein HELRODRAFT_85035 [Helobdella robusta]